MLSGWRRPLLGAGACWLAFGCLLAAAYWLPVARWADGWAVEGFLQLQNGWLGDVAYRFATLADPAPFAVFTVLLATVALVRGRPRHALAAVVLLGGASALGQALKALLAHDRPHEFLGSAQLGAASLPSGHATASMSLAFAAVLVAPPARRTLVAVGGALFALGVSESILLLAWHFPSDVAGGFLVATAWTLMTISALRLAEARWPERSGRAAARRAIAKAGLRPSLTIAAGFVVAALAGVGAAAGTGAADFAARHTTAVGAAVVVAALAALLPMAVATLAPRRP